MLQIISLILASVLAIPNSAQAPSFTETSPYCKAGIKSLIARHWQVDLNYTDRAEEELSFRVGVQFQLD